MQMSWIDKVRHFETTGEWYGLSNDTAIARVIKRYLLETRGHRCEICRNTEWLGQPIPLVLDHIDGNSADHRLENTRLVCGNCDMTLPTYKKRNVGNGRHYRRQRYAEGKSH